MRYSFVILHYMAPGVTRCCVYSILNAFRNADVSIVVVDNASPDGSGAVLKQEFAQIGKVHFVMLEENAGFARGNNAGYRFAVENLGPDFVIVLNNDVIVADLGFLDKIAAQYESSPFAVLGPDIYFPLGDRHQSPTRLAPMTLEEAESLKKKIERKMRHFFYHYTTWNIKLALWLKKVPAPVDQDSSNPHEGCVLQGACYIFSRDFIAKRQNAFNPATFLYLEEDILELECRRQGLKMRYSPELKVMHLEDASTRAAFSSEYRRYRMKGQRMLESLGIFIDMLRNE